MKKPLALLVLAFLATSLLATSYALATTPFTNTIFRINPTADQTLTSSTHQGIVGSVTIANVSPVCSLSGSFPATGPNLVITSSTGKIDVVVLSWSLVDRCELVAPFQVVLSPGTYSLNLSSCSYMGCRVLSITVVVLPGVFTPVKIDIVTGIV